MKLALILLATIGLWGLVAVSCILSGCTVEECKGCTIEVQIPKLPNCIEYVDGAFFLCPEAGADAGAE